MHNASHVYIMLHGKKGFADVIKVPELEIGRRRNLFGEPNLITRALKSQELPQVQTELKQKKSKRFKCVNVIRSHCQV